MSSDDLVVDVVHVDGKDTLAAVVIRPAAEGRVTVQAMADGIDKRNAAWVLRHVAAKWEREANAEAEAGG